MKLFFFRHGIAEPAHSGLRDWDRKLTPEGQAQLQRIGRAMQRMHVKPDLILTSPLVRAYQTAEVVAQALQRDARTAEELQPGCTFDDLQRLLRRYDAESVMLVGHQPDLSALAARLINADENSLVLKKAGLIRVDVEGRPQVGRGRLTVLLTPKVLLLMDAQTAHDET